MPALPPVLCETMDEVRAGVDETDRALVDLLARRFAFMCAAARIKPDRASVRDTQRKAEVIAAVSVLANERGLPADAIGEMWEALIETSIAYELDEYDAVHSSASGG